VGQKLKIYRSGAPMAQVKSGGSKSGSGGGSQGTVKTHTVKKGETLSSISRKYGCTVNDLKKWNNLKSNTVKVGQKLKIKK
jgi:LysM repeat protein